MLNLICATRQVIFFLWLTESNNCKKTCLRCLFFFFQLTSILFIFFYFFECSFFKNSFHGFVACPLVGLVLLLKLWIPSFPCLIERLIRLGFLLGCGLIACGKYEVAAAHFYLRLIELDYLNKKVCVAYLFWKKKFVSFSCRCPCGVIFLSNLSSNHSGFFPTFPYCPITNLATLAVLMLISRSFACKHYLNVYAKTDLLFYKYAIFFLFLENNRFFPRKSFFFKKTWLLIFC